MRVIIIVFALALVIIGAYPFRRELRSGHREVRGYLKREFGEILPAGRMADRGARPEGRDPVRTSRGSIKPVTDLPKAAPEERHLDRLSEADRHALDSFLNR